MKDPATYVAQLDAARRAIIEQALFDHAGSRTLAAKALGVQRSYLQRMMRQLGITVPPASRVGQGLGRIRKPKGTEQNRKERAK